jgi:hypothetical protein
MIQDSVNGWIEAVDNAWFRLADITAVYICHDDNTEDFPLVVIGILRTPVSIPSHGDPVPESFTEITLDLCKDSIEARSVIHDFIAGKWDAKNPT